MRWVIAAVAFAAVALAAALWWSDTQDGEHSSSEASWTKHSVNDYWTVVHRVYGSLGFTYHPTSCERLETVAPDGLALPPAPHGVLPGPLFGTPPPNASELFNTRWQRAMEAAGDATNGGPKNCFKNQEWVVRLTGQATSFLGEPR